MMHTRKKFIKNIAFTSALLLNNKMIALANNFGYCANTNDDDVIYFEKKDVGYENYRKGFNLRIEKFPKIIAVCNNTNGVVKALKIAREKKLNVAIKSGGHCMEGFSSNDDGMVINLSMMNNLQFIDKSTIKVQPAITLKKFTKPLFLKGFTCQVVVAKVLLLEV